MSPLSPAPGVRVGDRYTLTRRIAGGGMGEVWAATDEVLNREVAVKLLRGEHADDPAFLARFRAEARHAASLTHPGIAGVYDYGEDDGAAYIVMELIAGEPLSARLRRDGRLPPAIAVALLSQTAQALQAAHAAGLVHRDVKPANLMLTPDQQVKVTDFGIARLDSSEPVTRTGEVMGTAQYLSPEQATGRQAGPASDVYSLGVVGYEMLSGHRPFEANNPVAVAMAHVSAEPDPLPSDVPPALAAVIMQAMSKDPAGRPASAAAFSAALIGALSGGSAAHAGSEDRTVPIRGLAGAAAAYPAADATEVLPAAGAAAGTAPVPASVPAPAQRRSGGRILLALLVVAVLAVGGAVLSQQLGGGAPTPSLPTTTPLVPTTPSTPTTAPTSDTPSSDTSTTSEPSSSTPTTTDTPSSTSSSTSTTSDTSTTTTTDQPSASPTSTATATDAPTASGTGTPTATPSSSDVARTTSVPGPTTTKPAKTKPTKTKPTKTKPPQPTTSTQGRAATADAAPAGQLRGKGVW